MTSEKSNKPDQANVNQPSVKADTQEIAKALQGLNANNLTEHQSQVLEGMLESVAEKQPEMLVRMAFRQEFSGPLPQARELAAYDEETRKFIIAMAGTDQKHTHDMQRNGQRGAIIRDRVGQFCACIIALGGFGAAAWIAQYSAVASAIIGSFDILALVCAFIAPRSLELLIQSRQAPAEPARKKPVNRRQNKSR